MFRRASFSGEQLGPYLIRERIGQGGMADVYRAYQPTMNREVALKVIALVASSEHEFLERRFRLEAEMIASLEHPHILPIFDYAIIDNVLYIAMRYLRGGTLDDLLSGKPISLERAADLFTDVASALGYAHRRGVIHRDLKPSNILLDEEQNVYLSDFGLAKVLGGSAQISNSGTIVGTPAYMAPEQLRGDRVDHRADLYSLGIILYHMLTGRPPFSAQTTFSLIYQHVEKAPPSPRELNPDLPTEVDTVLLKALEKHPNNRYQSAEELASAFATAIGKRYDGVVEAAPVVHQPVLSWNEFDSGALRTGYQPTVAAMELPTPAWKEDRVPNPRFGAKRAFSIVAGLTLFALLVVALMISNQTQPLSVEEPLILSGVQARPEDVVPTDDEVMLAERALGEDGFIGYVTCNQTSEFFATLSRRLSDLAEEYGLELRLYDSETDANQAIIQIERARTEGAKALIVCVVDEEVAAGTLASVVEDGLPLVIHNLAQVPSFGGVITTYDEYMLGYMPGQYAGELVASRNGAAPSVVILDFPDLPSIVERANGLEDGFLESVPDATVVGRYLGGTANFARRSIGALLTNGTPIDVILSINDAGAYGAIDALEEAGIGPDEVIIAGIDAEAVARQYVKDGYYMQVTMEVGNVQIPSALLGAVIKQLAGSQLPQVIVLSPGDLIVRNP